MFLNSSANGNPYYKSTITRHTTSTFAPIIIGGRAPFDIQSHFIRLCSKINLTLSIPHTIILLNKTTKLK